MVPVDLGPIAEIFVHQRSRWPLLTRRRRSERQNRRPALNGVD